MRPIFKLLVFFSICALLVSCSNQSDQPQTLTATDSLWLNFVTAMEQKDLEFLLANSMDSIQCVDCSSVTPNWEDEMYEAEFLLSNHLKDLMHLEDLKTGFSTYQDSTLIRVGYSIESPKAEEGGYTLVFTLEHQNGKYLLSDRFFVP